MTRDEAERLFNDSLAARYDVIDQMVVEEDSERLMILSWVLDYVIGLSMRLTESFLRATTENPEPPARLHAHIKLMELHDMRVRHLRNDGTAWN